MRYIICFIILISSSFAVMADDIGVGDVPPSYVGRGMDNKKVELSTMKGKVIVVTFWSARNGQSTDDLAVLDYLQQKVGSDNMQVVAVNNGETKKVVKAVKAMLPDSNIVFTVVSKGYVSKEFDVRGLPHMLFLDRDGKVGEMHKGNIKLAPEKMVTIINGLLAKPYEESAK